MAALAFINHILFAVALFAFSTVLTWCMLRVGIMSTPNTRSSHDWPVPNSGGVAIVLSFFAGFLVVFLLSDDTRVSVSTMTGFTLAAIGIAIVSLLDDLALLRTFKI